MWTDDRILCALALGIGEACSSAHRCEGACVRVVSFRASPHKRDERHGHASKRADAALPAEACPYPTTITCPDTSALMR